MGLPEFIGCLSNRTLLQRNLLVNDLEIYTIFELQLGLEINLN